MAILTGVLLWLGLSPRLAQFFYQLALMPRCKSETAESANSAEIMVQKTKFRSGELMLNGEVYTPCQHVYTSARSQKLIVYFGGRRSNRAKNLIRVQALLNTGAAVFTFTYRGFGEEKGHASVDSLLRDGLAAYDAVKRMGYKPAQIVLYGESLGATVAAYVSSKRNVSGVILQSGFASLEVQMKDMIPILRVYPRCLFPKHDLSTVQSIQPGHSPLLIMHGDQDSVVDKKHAHWMAKSAGQNTRLIVFEGAGHVGVHLRDDWLAAVNEFIESL